MLMGGLQPQTTSPVGAGTFFAHAEAFWAESSFRGPTFIRYRLANSYAQSSSNSIELVPHGEQKATRQIPNTLGLKLH